MFLWTLSHELFGMFVGHLIGDFLAQSDSMARCKKTSSMACAFHVSVYTFFVMLCSGWLFVETWPEMWSLCAGVAIPHFIIDRFQLAYKYLGLWSPDFREKLAPWSIIITDQSLHAVCLFIQTLLYHWVLQNG